MQFCYADDEASPLTFQDKERWTDLELKHRVIKNTGSVWGDRSARRRAPPPTKDPAPWSGPDDARLPVIIVTGGVGCGRTTLAMAVAAELAAAARRPAGRDAAGGGGGGGDRGRARRAVAGVVTHRFWQEYGVAPRPEALDAAPREPGAAPHHRAVFDFGNACICCAPDGDFQVVMGRLADDVAAAAGGGDGAAAEDEAAFLAGVVVETTGLADPAMFARILLQSDALLARFALRSVVGVLDAPRAPAALAARDEPGAKNASRLQLLASDRVVLSHGGDAPDGGARARDAVDALFADAPGGGAPSAVRVDVAADLRRDARALAGAIVGAAIGGGERGGGFTPAAVLARRPGFLGDAELDKRKPCRFARPLVSFEPSVGVLSAIRIVERGAVFEPMLRALADALVAPGGEGRIARVKGACLLRSGGAGASARQEALLFDAKPGHCAWARVDVSSARGGGERGGGDDAWRARLGAAGAAASASRVGEPAHWPSGDDGGAHACQLFVLGRRLNAARLRDALRACMVPRGFVYAADAELDFPGGAKQRAAPGGGEEDDDDDDDDDDDGWPSDEDEGEKKETAAAARAPASVTVAINVAAEGATEREVDVQLHRREDGGFHATRGARDAKDDDELEVLRLFGSALYVNAGDL